MMENGRGQEEKQVLGASWEEVGLGTTSVSEYEWGVCSGLGRCVWTGGQDVTSLSGPQTLPVYILKNQAAGLFYIQYILCSPDGSGVNNLRGNKGESVDFIHYPFTHLSIFYPQTTSHLEGCSNNLPADPAHGQVLS